MKNKICIIIPLIITIVILILAFVNNSNADLWTKINTIKLKTKKPTAAYQLDTIMGNLRVYEFDTENNKHCVLVYIISERKSPIMQCW